MGKAMGKDLVIGPADLSWLEKAIAAHLTGLGIKHDLEKWGPRYAHGWNAWREMLPRYVSAYA